MTVTIEKVPRANIGELLLCKLETNLSMDEMIHLDRFIKCSPVLWQGSKDGRVMCIWGLMPPTMLDNYAYMWLQIIEPIGDFEFVLVRHSQRAIAKALEDYPTIHGHCEPGNARAIRWIKWLGGVFGHPEAGLLPFTIKAKEA